MLALRRTDYYGQLVLCALMVLSIPFLRFYGFSAGLFAMGCWQLLSAVLNTNAFLSFGQRKQICLYWIVCTVACTALLIAWLTAKMVNQQTTQILCWVAVPGAVLAAAYYLKIYSRLIELLLLRNELDGLTKSKH